MSIRVRRRAPRIGWLGEVRIGFAVSVGAVASDAVRRCTVGTDVCPNLDPLGRSGRRGRRRRSLGSIRTQTGEALMR
jgi:hypothetical protein